MLALPFIHAVGLGPFSVFVLRYSLVLFSRTTSSAIPASVPLFFDACILHMSFLFCACVHENSIARHEVRPIFSPRAGPQQPPHRPLSPPPPSSHTRGHPLSTDSSLMARATSMPVAMNNVNNANTNFPSVRVPPAPPSPLSSAVSSATSASFLASSAASSSTANVPPTHFFPIASVPSASATSASLIPPEHLVPKSVKQAMGAPSSAHEAKSHVAQYHQHAHVGSLHLTHSASTSSIFSSLAAQSSPASIVHVSTSREQSKRDYT